MPSLTYSSSFSSLLVLILLTHGTCLRPSLKSSPKGTGFKHVAGHGRLVVQDPELSGNAERLIHQQVLNVEVVVLPWT